jgi:EAL domain-containing protein (putative c-di-GMP-specific phosphodiesterase class I)
LGFSVVGEGVETQSVLDELAASGCDIAQGFLFTRPIPVENLVVWLNDFAKVAAVSLS